MTEPKNAPTGKLLVAPAPHVRHSDRTSTIMYDVSIALLPAIAWGIYLFGIRALLLCLISVMAALLSEWAYEKIMRRPVSVSDGSAVVTGLLLALNLPVTAPLWLPVLGSAFAIIVAKQLFGGLGKNFVNPALSGRLFLFLSFPALMTAWTHYEPNLVDWWRIGVPQQYDVLSTATPLGQMLTNGTLNPITRVSSRWNLLIGFRSGCIGEVCAAAILLGGIYLLVRRVISWHIPVSYLGTVALITFLFPMHDAPRLTFMLCQLCAGGVLFAAFFMATDYVTCPITKTGRLIFGVGCGLFTVLIRYFGSFAEGASFAILVMNLLVPYIDKITAPRRFGAPKRTDAKQASAPKA